MYVCVCIHIYVFLLLNNTSVVENLNPYRKRKSNPNLYNPDISTINILEYILLIKKYMYTLHFLLHMFTMYMEENTSKGNLYLLIPDKPISISLCLSPSVEFLFLSFI